MTSSKFTEPVPELNKVHDTLTETILLHCTLKICLSDIGGGKGRNNTPSPSSNIGKQSCLEYEAGFMENDTNLETKIISNQKILGSAEYWLQKLQQSNILKMFFYDSTYLVIDKNTPSYISKK